MVQRATGEEGDTAGATNVPGQVEPLADITNEAVAAEKGADGTTATGPKGVRAPPRPRQRGPPEDGVPSKTKVMVANLPYDLREDKVSCCISGQVIEC